jgi:hypothetical protein
VLRAGRSDFGCSFIKMLERSLSPYLLWGAVNRQSCRAAFKEGRSFVSATPHLEASVHPGIIQFQTNGPLFVNVYCQMAGDWTVKSWIPLSEELRTRTTDFCSHSVSKPQVVFARFGGRKPTYCQQTTVKRWLLYHALRESGTGHTFTISLKGLELSFCQRERIKVSKAKYCQRMVDS